MTMPKHFEAAALASDIIISMSLRLLKCMCILTQVVLQLLASSWRHAGSREAGRLAARRHRPQVHSATRIARRCQLGVRGQQAHRRDGCSMLAVLRTCSMPHECSAWHSQVTYHEQGAVCMGSAAPQHPTAVLAVQLSCSAAHTAAAIGKVPAAHNLCLHACQCATACRAAGSLAQ